MAEVIKNATMKNPAFWVCLILSIGLIVAGFCTPPLAKIDGSVLTAVGLLFAFATLEVAHIAIKRGLDAKVKHGKTEVTIGDNVTTTTDTQIPENDGTEIEE